MFIDCSKFEKVLKADYKSWGVKFGLTKKDDVYSPWHWLDNRGECFIHQQGVPRYRNKGIRTGTKAGGVYQISKGQQSTA